ncbi:MULTISPECIES: D-2-hydroxyacid dehydrogenase [unclassified Campylobacter]|uniref:D-2-hydroxyacid dehydrogenase n=1 Tax=unclassified Campylobacter TaxID=2593542 RepID=UPI0022E9A666|nr:MULTISPECIES: D-2-hydroxyacid dehydrogenase [unclassified Campylobacter]MDA3062953.1 D-2-hydroxyacid dehydrogenase [Campylobacter sp. JMF_14 EL1]MDA3074108.1 D-2-hydroxyacid dehydrogenase [Campylobacter sp. JMF_10 EL2]
MKPKIVLLDADTLGSDANFSEFEALGELVTYPKTKPEQTIERLAGADIVITNKVLITKEVLEKTNLKLICVSATGTNNIDSEAAAAHGVPVKNVAGYSTKSVSQQAFATLLALLNDVRYYAEYGEKKWCESEIFTHLNAPIDQISDKNFGIIGLGEIGREVGRIAKAFGANVCYYSTSGAHDDAEFKRVDLDTMLKECDIISVHAPLNEKTKGLIGKDEIAKMKKGAVFMNFGRGGIADESALAWAIDEMGLRVGLDVVEKEPINADNPLLGVKNKANLILTPHIAWASVEARKLLISKIAGNIKEFLNA